MEQQQQILHSSASGEWNIARAEYGLFLVKVLAFFMTVLSATLLLPWAKTIVIEKWTSNLVIDGRRVRYTGSGAGLFGVWLKIWALSVITLTVYYWIYGRKAVANYIDSHIQWA